MFCIFGSKIIYALLSHFALFLTMKSSLGVQCGLTLVTFSSSIPNHLDLCPRNVKTLSQHSLKLIAIENID